MTAQFVSRLKLTATGREVLKNQPHSARNQNQIWEFLGEKQMKGWQVPLIWISEGRAGRTGGMSSNGDKCPQILYTVVWLKLVYFSDFNNCELWLKVGGSATQNNRVQHLKTQVQCLTTTRCN